MHDITASDRLAIKRFATKNPVFVCVISYTATSEISGLTVAGANAELVKYTSPADAEFLYYGHCRCIDVVPATPDGKPTPAIITRTALQLARIPILVVDAGAKVKPSIPYVSFGVEPGKNIVNENAMDISSVMRAFEHGELLGKQLAIMSDLIVVGESIPGGTTTALAVLSALGIDARFKVSEQYAGKSAQSEKQGSRFCTGKSQCRDWKYKRALQSYIYSWRSNDAFCSRHRKRCAV